MNIPRLALLGFYRPVKQASGRTAMELEMIHFRAHLSSPELGFDVNAGI
jgi:hypothetical protein